MTDYIVDSRGVVTPYPQWRYDSDWLYGTYSRYGTDSLSMADSLSAALAERKTFLTEVIENNLARIRLGQLAQANGRSEGVRYLGKMLEENHAALNRVARIVAYLLDIKPPRKVKPEAGQEHERLSKLGAEAFDGEFLRHIIAVHRRTIRPGPPPGEAQGVPRLCQ